MYLLYQFFKIAFKILEMKIIECGDNLNTMGNELMFRNSFLVLCIIIYNHFHA